LDIAIDNTVSSKKRTNKSKQKSVIKKNKEKENDITLKAVNNDLKKEKSKTRIYLEELREDNLQDCYLDNYGNEITVSLDKCNQSKISDFFKNTKNYTPSNKRKYSEL